MKMEKMPEVIRTNDGAFWGNSYEKFDVDVYVPNSPLEGDILNYGFMAPYLLIFTDKKLTRDEEIAFAREKGFEKLASDFDSSVVFISPETGDWNTAAPDILSEIISNSKIHQYHKDGVVIANNFFRHSIDGYYIRGAIFRIILCGYGSGADYIAKNCLCHFEGDGLWGRSDLAPATCILNGLSVLPDVKADDIPVISYGNSEEANAILKKGCKHFLKRADAATADVLQKDFYDFARRFRRMNGPLQIDPDLEKNGLVIEPGIAEVKTSKDNAGDDKGTETHKIGYFAFYNKDCGAVRDGTKGDGSTVAVPLVLGFHGGGDSCFFFATMAGWAKIAHRHNFLLVTIENHLNSTATEMIELLEILKKKYNIDTTRIYATGFSMGGCKTWDMVQEYPQVIAAAAPMDATWDVGCNVYGNKVEGGINETVPVPIFYAGGEITPLPELPCQAQKCLDRMSYVLWLNNANAAERYDEEVVLENKENWENKIWGINGDEVEQLYDESRDAMLTMQKFASEDGRILSVFASISGQGHDCREHTCENAWQFMSRFHR